MRIIAGSAKGRRLAAPAGFSIRPTADRAKEALFSIIISRLPDAVILDLFAGAGSLGLEALSRGAKEAIFVDHGKEALALIAANIRACGFTPQQAKLIRHGLRRGLPKEITGHFFHVIFLDPPYDQGLAEATLTLLGQGMPAELIVAEERHNCRLTARYGNYVCQDKRRYGDTAFWFFTPGLSENRPAR
ncbi:MAG: 16S rRNA (guanine(966)-N(2))-methyltransferase RsmD [Desulfobulbaceae bacterium]|nr:16S rRNA (guanine(966)-N(2))-methyltransferase RsmD [Desulfobulbaceae bacterium]